MMLVSLSYQVMLAGTTAFMIVFFMVLDQFIEEVMMPNKQKDERRYKARVSFDAQIKLKLSDVEIESPGNSKDMSLNGIFVNTDLRPEIGKKCDVEVILTGGIDDLLLSMRGIVTRHDKKGIGINFNSMGLESYTHLKNIVRYNVNSTNDDS